MPVIFLQNGIWSLWKVVASELNYSVQHIYYLHNKALEKLRVHQSS